MATLLTETGWELSDGTILGTWTNQADIVDELEIFVDFDVIANTLNGDDAIIGAGLNNSINNKGTLLTGNGNDCMEASSGGIALRLSIVEQFLLVTVTMPLVLVEALASVIVVGS